MKTEIIKDINIPGISSPVCQVNVPEISNPIYVRSGTSDLHTFHQIFHLKEYEIEVDFEPGVIIDAGANIGLAAIYFANKYRNAKIICIEPEESNFSLLEKNVSDYKNIHCYQRALSNVAGQSLNVIDHGYGHWGFMTETPENSHDKNIKGLVKTITIDEIIEGHGFKTIDLCKIDIEGAEKELFESNFQNWLFRTRCIIIELHERMRKDSSKSFLDAMAKYDFSSFEKGENKVYINNDKR